MRVLPASDEQLIEAHCGAPPRLARGIILRLGARHRLIRWAPAGAGVLAFFGWMEVFTQVGRSVPSRDGNLFDWFRSHGAVGMSLAGLAGFGVGITLCFLVVRWSRWFLLRRCLRRRYPAPSCFECGYNLSSIPQDEAGFCRCPECGSRSEIRAYPGTGPPERTVDSDVVSNRG